jgi:glucosamine 6-phosphate synthetase-like amidotransferase/phosphosugar isomerase protein
LRRVCEITTANLLGNEERGKDAAGIAVIQRDGGCRLFKHPVRASDLVAMPGYDEILASIDDETICILAHTRMPTKGSRWHNVNNHPIRAGHVVGIHNGVFDNDDELFSACQLPREGEVDSEIVFRLQDQVDPVQVNGEYGTLIQRHICRLDGRFATLSVDLRKPTRLLALKHLRPLCLHYERSLDALFFSSRYIFLRKAFGRSVITEALETGFGYCFDARHLPESGSLPLERFEIVPDVALCEEVAL